MNTLLLVALAAQPLTVDEAVQLRARTLEEQMTELKEKILHSKERLRELERITFGGDLASKTWLTVESHDDVGAGWRLQSVSFALDGAPIAVPFRARLVSGQHQLAVRMVYRGTGLGVFPYQEGYKLSLSSAQTFSLAAGHTTIVGVFGYVKADPTLEATQRLGVRFELKSE